MAGRHTAAGHAEKAGEQNDVGEELQENHVGREPTDARQFQEENQESGQEQIKPLRARPDLRNRRQVIHGFCLSVHDVLTPTTTVVLPEHEPTPAAGKAGIRSC